MANLGYIGPGERGLGLGKEDFASLLQVLEKMSGGDGQHGS